MSGFNLNQMLGRKKKIQQLKFQKTIEKESKDIEKDKQENSKKIQAVRKSLMQNLEAEIEKLAEFIH